MTKRPIIVAHYPRGPHVGSVFYSLVTANASTLKLIAAGRFDTLYSVAQAYLPGRHD